MSQSFQWNWFLKKKNKQTPLSSNVLLYLFYLLVDLLVSWMESQGPQKQMSGAFRRTSILQLTLGCHYPQGLKGRGNKSLVFAFINPLFCLSTHRLDMIVSCSKFKIPGLSECIASIEENTLLIWPLVAWWRQPREKDHHRHDKTQIGLSCAFK